MRRVILAGEKTQWVAAWLPAAILAVTAAHPIRAAAEQTDCAEYSLSRNEIARAMAAARTVLSGNPQLQLISACWTPDHSSADLATPRTQTPEGVQQWWSVSCRRSESTWACERSEFKQLIVANLVVGESSHAVELSFGPGIAVERARALASQALARYLDPDSRVRSCNTIDDSVDSRVGSHGSDKRQNVAEPFHVNVIHDGSMESVWLNDVGVIISFDSPGDQRSCWRDIVTAN